MSTSHFRLPCYRQIHSQRHHPYAVPDRQAWRKAFDPVAYIMPSCVIDVFYPPGGLLEVSEVISELALSATPAVVNELVATSVEDENGHGTTGAATSYTGTTRSIGNSLGLAFQNDEEELPSDQSIPCFGQLVLVNDGSSSGTGDSSVPSSPMTATSAPMSPGGRLPPLAGLAFVRNFSLARHGQEPASPLDLMGLGEVLNELERPEGEEGALARSDSALLLDFSLAMQHFSRIRDRLPDV